MKTIFVYKDKGVGATAVKALIRSLKESVITSNYTIKLITAEELTMSFWEKNCALLAMPGGRDIPYHQALKGKGNQKIKRYVEDGGRYLGICAGAYYGSKQVIFEKGLEHEVIEPRELSFFPGNAIGTLYREKPFSYEGHDSAHAALIQEKEEALYTYYNGGCYFENAESFAPDVEILATYQNAIFHNAPAIILCRAKKGKALLSGVHFEVSPKYVVKEKKLYMRMQADEKKRQKLFDHLLKRILN